jgi:hypothetical protein
VHLPAAWLAGSAAGPGFAGTDRPGEGVRSFARRGQTVDKPRGAAVRRGLREGRQAGTSARFSPNGPGKGPEIQGATAPARRERVKALRERAKA